MRVGRVVGKVVLSDRVPEYKGGRWLLVSPCGRDEFSDIETPRISADPTVVVYDNLGGAEGDLIGFTEGGEAMKPFADPMPVDAYCACLLDKLYLDPRYRSEA